MRRYFSIIIGEGCNARCPFCISRPGVKSANPMDIEELRLAAQFARREGSEVCSVSGGGEPLLMAAKYKSEWGELVNAIECFSKRDLHSNLSIWPQGAMIEQFSDLTISLWPQREITTRYMGRDLHDRIITNCARIPGNINLRVSSVIGRDWCSDSEQVLDMVDLAKQLGAKQLTLRELQNAQHLDQTWMQEYHLPLAGVEEWLASGFPLIRQTAHGSPVFEVEGLEVCCYNYSKPGQDQEFLFFRPDSYGRYGLFTDYQDDSCRVDIPGGISA